MSPELEPTSADVAIRQCLIDAESFYVIAGAGSGKTTSLTMALGVVRDLFGDRLRRDGQRVACVTYTKRAVAVIQERLRWDGLYLIDTLHSFLWQQVSRLTSDIRRVLCGEIIPAAIAKAREADNGGSSKSVLEARARAVRLEDELSKLHGITKFVYGDSQFSDYSKGELGHDDVIAVASRIILQSEKLRAILGQKYPYIFVDEAQDTHEEIINAFNAICSGQGLPVVGYFGDPMQQIYDKRAGVFSGPNGSRRIPKIENFRSAKSVVRLLNNFRSDLEQTPTGKSGEVEGSVAIRLIQAEAPNGERGRYSDDQVDRASANLDEALMAWGWADRVDVKHLYLVRQMIARKLKFAPLHKLFTGPYSSSRSQDDYESGEHYLLKPFLVSLVRLVSAHVANDQRLMISLLRQFAPAYSPRGPNARRSLREMLSRADDDVARLSTLWSSATVGEILRFAAASGLCSASERLMKTLGRSPREETYDELVHNAEKGDWLADEFLKRTADDIHKYCEFLSDSTPFRTQHGVKGEQYPNVLVVFDDVGSAWTNYSFTKTLTPKTEGRAPTERQKRLSNNLAYVCFSRAESELRIVMYTTKPEAAKAELVGRGLFLEEQVVI